MSTTDQILRPAEAAAMLGITRSTLNRWRERPGFPQPLRLGPAAIGFRASDLRDWLDNRPTA